MADNFDDMEFWLPPQFLSEDEDDVYSYGSDRKKGFMSREQSFGSGTFGCYVTSDLGSPVDSVVSSTDSERNDDECLAWLTRKLKNSSIDGVDNSKASAIADSHRVNACRNRCGCALGVSHGSPTGPLKAASSPATWDLLYAAAGEVAKMRFNAEEERFYGALARKPSSVSVPVNKSNPDFDSQFNQSVYQQQQYQAIRFQQMEQVMMMKQHKQALWEEQLRTNLIQRQQQLIAHQNNQMNLSAVTWPPLKPQQNQQDKSGMRAVFLGHPPVKKERAGTGVFLPRRDSYPPQSRKKATFSNALLPPRVVQALNLDDLCNPAPPLPSQHQPHYGCSLDPESDTSMRIRNINNLLLQAQQNRQIRQQPVVNHEIGLPQEWTY